jgi:hypothetical protein
MICSLVQSSDLTATFVFCSSHRYGKKTKTTSTGLYQSQSTNTKREIGQYYKGQPIADRIHQLTRETPTDSPTTANPGKCLYYTKVIAITVISAL